MFSSARLGSSCSRRRCARAVRLEDGILTIRYPDDPDEVIALPRLAAQVRGRAADLRTAYQFQNGAHRWVTAVVVLWADFPQRRIEHGGIAYLHGDELVDWLQSLPERERPSARASERLALAPCVLIRRPSS